MGLRSFVALPVGRGGTVIRLKFEHAQDADTDSLTTSADYGSTFNLYKNHNFLPECLFSAKQALRL
jgi:hypothetical protein